MSINRVPVHPVYEKSVEIFWADIYRGRLFFRAESSLIQSKSPIQSCRSLQDLYLCKRLKSSPKTRDHVKNDHVTIFDQNGRRTMNLTPHQSLNTMFLS
jgi:hypothetical protein